MKSSSLTESRSEPSDHHNAAPGVKERVRATASRGRSGQGSRLGLPDVAPHHRRPRSAVPGETEQVLPGTGQLHSQDMFSDTLQSKMVPRETKRTHRCMVELHP